MTKIARFQGEAPKPADWPWWTLVEAVVWIVGEEGYSEPVGTMGGDADYSAREWAANELRTALAQGRVTAYGLKSHSEKPDRIDPVDWNSREVPITDIVGVRAWQDEPYRRVVVARDEIKGVWPAPFWVTPLKAAQRGRPEEFDWQRIFEMADEERRENLSDRKLHMILQARCRDELGYRQGQPSVEAIRYQLTKARNKSP